MNQHTCLQGDISPDIRFRGSALFTFGIGMKWSPWKINELKLSMARIFLLVEKKSDLGSEKREKSSENDKSTGHFQSFFFSITIFFFHRLLGNGTAYQLR